MPVTEVEGRALKTQPLWARVDANRTKLTVFVVLFVLGSALLLAGALVAVPGALIGAVYADAVDNYWWTYGLVVVGAVVVLLTLGSIMSAVQLANAEDWVKHRFNGRPLEPGEAPELERVVADMALAGGLSGPPSLLVLEEAGENAFALGTVRKRATIGVTRGMLEAFSADELRAVVATLTARIVAGDIMFATALAALMGPIKAIRESRKVAAAGAGEAANGCSGVPFDSAAADGCGDGCGCALGGLDDSDSGGIIFVVIFVIVVAVITYLAVVTAAWIVTLWGRALNRTSYEKADAEGMLLLKSPEPMISALRKAITSSTLVSEGDQSYDGIFYTSTSGTPRIERAERRRFERLCEVLGVEGLMARLDEPPPA